MPRNKKNATKTPAVEPVVAVEAAPVIEAQPPADNDHVAPGCELFTEAPAAPEVPPALVTKAGEAEPLADYLAKIEEIAQPLAVCQVTHPDAIDGAIHQGTYAGIRLVKGDKIAAVLSSGETI